MKAVFGILIVGLLCVHPAFASPDHMSEAELRQKYQTPESKFMDLDEVRIHYYDQGKGPTIIFIHGEMENLHAWDGVAARLVNQFRVVRFDVPDCGLSGPDPKRRYSFEGYADLLGRFTDKLKIGKFALGGSSWGASVAYTYAVAHPDHVAALVLISTPGVRDANKSFYAAVLNVIGSSGAREPRDRGDPGSTAKLPDRAPVLQMATIESRIRSVIQDDAFLTPKKLQEYYDMANREGRAADAAARSKLILPEENLAYARPIIAKISSPTLIIWGLNNPAFSPGAADDIIGLIPASVMTRKAIYDNVGHKVEEESPKQVASDTRHFLEDVGFWKPD